MGTVSDPPESPGTVDEEESDSDDALTALYREYVGASAQQRDIWLGFGLFFGGVALGAVGFVLFFYSGLQEAGSAIYWQFREIALVAGLLGMPSVVGSIVVLLPVGRRARLVTASGGLLCLVAIGVLVPTYPYDWTVQGGLDGSLVSISLYASGLILLSASTGSALVAQYLDAVTTGDERPSESPSEATEDTADSDPDVESDIEAALDDAELSWGGVEQQSNTKRLDLDMPETDADIEETAIDEADATTNRTASDDVDDAVDGLRQLQGGESNTARGSSTEEQVDALTQFREQREEEKVETGVDEDRSAIDRLQDWLTR